MFMGVSAWLKANKPFGSLLQMIIDLLPHRPLDCVSNMNQTIGDIFELTHLVGDFRKKPFFTC